MFSIPDLMQVPAEEHDIEWLKKSLQAATTLAARELMQKPIPGGTGNFGPDFRLKH